MTQLKWQVGQTLRQGEREMIEATLKECGNNKTQAAQMLGTTNRTIRYKVKSYNAVGTVERKPRKTPKARRTTTSRVRRVAA